jgi:predicted NBD/HSP70 family sugar kinase
VASLTGIEQNLLPYWLTRFEDHQLGRVQPLAKAAKLVRGSGERGDPLALRIFEQQAMALGRLFTIAANFIDPSTYFLGGGLSRRRRTSATGSRPRCVSTRHCVRNRRP